MRVHLCVHLVINALHPGAYRCFVFFWNVVMGVNLMQGEGKAWSVDGHRRDHSLQCA